MDIFCFICKQSFTDCKKLFCHIKTLHHLPSNYVYECGFLSCSQKFNCFKVFSRHVRNEYSKKLAQDSNINNKKQSTNLLPNNDNNVESTNNIVNSDIPTFTSNNLSETQNIISSKTTNINSKLLSLHSFKLTLQTYANKHFARKEATKLQKNIEKNLTHPIRDELQKIINDITTDNFEQKKSDLTKLVTFCDRPFDDFDTEYKFIKKLKTLNMYESPKVIYIDNSISTLYLNQVSTLDPVKVKAILFPIKFQIKKFFQIEGIYEAFENNLKSLYESANLNNFCNGTYWKNKIKQYGNKFVIPYFLYFDDFEVNNCIGPHCSSLLGVYYSFPTAPEWLKFKLNHIFIAALYNSNDVKSFGNDKCFYKLVEVLNDMEENGVEIETKNGKKKIYLSLGLIVGDNLALNNVLGFSRSFSAKYFCRTCKLNKNETKNKIEENTRRLRTIENYEEDIELNEPQNTGVRESSIFNKINNYHVVENLYADLLHDMLEGVLKYDFCHIILFLIKTKCFDLELFNIRKQNFNYGETEKGNKSTKIKMEHLKAFKLKMSGSEMLTFAHFFPLMIGDLVDVTSDLWKFVINLIELVDLMLLSHFTNLDILNLKSRIEIHNREYINIFSDTLKPKHHFLSHYCRIVENSGPFIYLWTFNFESKHRDLKSYTKNINARKNVTLSLAIKFCISFAETVMNFEKQEYVLDRTTYQMKLSPYYNELKKSFSTTDDIDNCTCYYSFSRCGTTYHKGFIIFFYDPNLKALQIQEIFVLNDEIYILCQHLKVLSYEQNLLSYLVDKKLFDFEILKASSIKSPPIHIYPFNNQNYLRLKSIY